MFGCVLGHRVALVVGLGAAVSSDCLLNLCFPTRPTKSESWGCCRVACGPCEFGSGRVSANARTAKPITKSSRRAEARVKRVRSFSCAVLGPRKAWRNAGQAV